MIPRDVKSPTVAIPFNKMLKIVAVVDHGNAVAGTAGAARGRQFRIELRDDYTADVSEDASVGAYIGSVEGGLLPYARGFLRSLREAGFRTPVWAMADTLSIADMDVVEMAGEVDGFVYLGQQTSRPSTPSRSSPA